MDISIPRLPYAEDKVFGFLFFIVFIIPLAFDVYNYESFEIIKYGLLLLLIGASLVAFGRKKNIDGSAVRGSRIFFWVVGAFWLWALLSSIFAWDKNFSFLGFYGRFTNGLVFYSLWSIFLLLLAFLNREKIAILLKVLAFCAGLVAVWGLLQSVGFGFYTGPTTDLFTRAAPSFLGNPDFASMFLAGLLPISAGFFYTAKTFRLKTYYGISIFFQVWALIVFASRGALVAAIMGLLVAFFLALLFRKQGLKFLAVLLVIFALGFLFNKGFLSIIRPGTIQTITSFNDSNIQNRFGVWKLSLQSIMKRPVFGVGLGNFQLMFEHDRTSQIINGGFFDDAHNLPLELSVTGGLPLLIFFLFLIILGALSGLKELANGYDPEVICIVSSLAAWLVASLFNPVVIPCYIALAVLISCCFRQSINLKTDNFFLSGIPKKFSLFLGGALIIYGCLFLVAEHLFFAGLRAYGSHRFEQSYNLTTAAIRLNPVNRLYYVYAAGSAIRSDKPMDKISPLLNTVEKINSKLAQSHVETANLNYLLLYQTQNPAYQALIIDSIKKSIAMDPYLSNNYFLLAQYDMAFRDLDAASANMEKGLALSPADFNSWLLMAKIYQLQNNRQQLIFALNRAHIAQPENIEPLRLLRFLQENSDIQKLPFNINLALGSL